MCLLASTFLFDNLERSRVPRPTSRAPRPASRVNSRHFFRRSAAAVESDLSRCLWLATAMRPAYIAASGRLVRGRGGIWPGLRRGRALLVVAALATLFISNPANGLRDWGWFKPSAEKTNPPNGFSASSLHRSATSLLENFLNGVSDGGRTNYVLFALRDGVNGVTAEAAGLEGMVCRHDWTAHQGPSICALVAEKFCHGRRMFDDRDRPFTAHRFLVAALIGSALLALCTKPGYWYFPPPTVRRPLASLASVLLDGVLVEDVISCNVLVYPALEAMGIFFPWGDGSAWIQYYASAGVLVLGLGGFANAMATRIHGRPTFGLHGACAASCGYLLAVAPRNILIRYLGFINMNASDVLLAVTVLGIADGFGVAPPLRGGRGGGSVISWCVGGMAGSFLGQFQLDRFRGRSIDGLILLFRRFLHI